MKKLICGVLVLSLMVSIMSTPAYANSSLAEKTTAVYIENMNSNFQNAPDDTIVCYMDGIPIRKADVNEFGVVKKDLRSAQKNTTQMITRQSASSDIIYYSARYSPIPLGTTSRCTLVMDSYNDAIISTTITAPRYSQTNVKLYLSPLSGAQFASSIENGWISNTVFTLAGFLPKVGPLIVVFWWASSLYNAGICSDIRSYTDYGNSVRINRATSNYGTFYGVFEWDGNYCPMVEVQRDNYSMETLNAVNLK